MPILTLTTDFGLKAASPASQAVPSTSPSSTPALLNGTMAESPGLVLADPVRHDAVPPQRETSRLVGRIVQVDRYGNLITDTIHLSRWRAGVRTGGENENGYGF